LNEQFLDNFRLRDLSEKQSKRRSTRPSTRPLSTAISASSDSTIAPAMQATRSWGLLRASSASLRWTTTSRQATGGRLAREHGGPRQEQCACRARDSARRWRSRKSGSSSTISKRTASFTCLTPSQLGAALPKRRSATEIQSL